MTSECTFTYCDLQSKLTTSHLHWCSHAKHSHVVRAPTEETILVQPYQPLSQQKTLQFSSNLLEQAYTTSDNKNNSNFIFHNKTTFITEKKKKMTVKWEVIRRTGSLSKQNRLRLIQTKWLYPQLTGVGIHEWRNLPLTSLMHTFGFAL